MEGTNAARCVGPVLLALATLTFVENFETQRFFVIAIEATE
ncbi:MAG: hypothetical protein SFV23_00025 [Planctomycetaceae bacterium]|nr:hypothetical protein [Planctomycetaceae bacterium]